MSYEESTTIMDIPTQLSNIVENPVSYDKSIMERNSVRWNAQGVEYGETQKEMVIRVNTAGYVDASTAYLGLDLKVKWSGSTILEDGILNLLANCQCYISGKQVERIENASALLPLVHHACSEAWLQGEGKASGMYRYIKCKGLETSIKNSDSTDTANNSTNIGIANSDTSNLIGDAQEQVFLPRVDGTFSSVKIGENSGDKIFTGATYRHNSMEVCGKNGNEACWNELSEGTNHNGDKSRRLYLSLGLIFGLFRIKETYLPVRNMPIELRFSLRNFAECFITPIPCIADKLQGRPIPVLNDQTSATHATEPKTNGKVAEVITDITDPNFGAKAYSITNVHILADVLTPNPALSNKIDSLAQGSGIQLVIDSYSVSQFPIQYNENISLNSSRNYSHLKDLYTHFSPAEISTNTFLNKADKYYGSVCESFQTCIGSRTLPSSMPQDSLAEMYLNVKKCLGNMNHIGSGKGVVSLAAYQGKPEYSSANSYKRAWSHGFIPNLKIAKKTGALTDDEVIRKLISTHRLPSQAHSDFMLAENTQRVLNQNSLSGLNTLGSSYQITQKIKFKKFEDASVDGNVLSSANNASLDNCWGNTNINATMLAHYDVLVSCAEGMVSVLE